MKADLGCLFAAWLREAAEKAVRFPLWPSVIIRHFDHELPDNVFILPCGREVNRLVEIIRRRVVAVGQPVLVNLLLLRRAGSNIHRQGRNAATNETVLIAADKHIS